MAAEEAVQDEAVVATLVSTAFFFYFVLLHITVHFFSVELCPKLNYFLTPSLEELATHEYNILWSCTQMSGHARMLRSEDSNVALSVKCFKKVLYRSGCPPPL